VRNQLFNKDVPLFEKIYNLNELKLENIGVYCRRRLMWTARDIQLVRSKYGSMFPAGLGTGAMFTEIEDWMIMAYLTWINVNGLPETEENFTKYRIELSNGLIASSSGTG
jgi:hypothetical protein